MSPAHPPSPCTGVCTLDPDSRICRGCHRTLGEIAVWSSASAEEKHAILQALPQRNAALHPAS